MIDHTIDKIVKILEKEEEKEVLQENTFNRLRELLYEASNKEDTVVEILVVALEIYLKK